jgi:segregation and condensation protein B
MDPTALKSVLEAMLFAADEPLTAATLAEATELEENEVAAALGALRDDYEAQGRGVRLAEMAGGWIVVTRAEHAPYVARLLRGKKRMRLSRPALETLAIIAYKQPVTKAEVDAIRGVDSSGVLNTLLERELVTIRGRARVLGRPLLYGTTGTFLTYFGLKDLNELPRVEELKAIVGEKEAVNPEAEPELELPLPGGEAGEGDEPRSAGAALDDDDEPLDALNDDVPEAAFVSTLPDDDESHTHGDEGAER